MKYFLIVLIALLTQRASFAQQKSYFPVPLGFINDFEHDFTADQVKALDLAVKELLVKTMEIERLQGIEIAVVTVTDSMYGNQKEMSDYAKQLGDKWGVGSKEDNKAIIIAYGKKIRKVAIVAGTGLDKILPPEVCKRIIDEQMAAEFKKGKYYDAILAAINGIKGYLDLN